MAIVFAARADNASYTARYSLNSTTGRAVMGTISHDVDATAINGYNWNLAQAGASGRAISWPFKGVIQTKEISVLIRMKISSTALSGFWQLGQACGHSINNMMLYQSSNLFQMVCFSSTWNTGVKIGSFSGGGAPPTGAWTDVVITWDGTNAANALKLWVDGTNVTSETMTQQWTAPTEHDVFTIGGVTSSVPNAHCLVEEVVVWNEVIVPTSVTLESGSGSLNGPSRISLVSVSPFNAGNYSDPGIANVKLATDYIYAGQTLTGTYNVSADYPTTTSVRYGDSFNNGNSTGTLVVPSAANVRAGITFDNGTVGTMDDDADQVTVSVVSYDTVTVTVTEI